MKKKVLFLVNHEIVIYNFRKELVQELINHDYEVIISSPPGEKIERLVTLGCKHIETKISRHGTNPIKDISLLIHYWKLVKESKPDIILTYTIKPNIYGGIASLIHRKPYIANITGLGSAVENKGLLQKITKVLYKISFWKINNVFFQNEDNLNFFLNNKIISSDYKVIPGSGVNTQEFMLLPYPAEDCDINFVFISRIMKEKGIDQYLEAAKYIKNKYKNVNFHICGFCEEAYEAELLKLTEDGTVKYHGMVDDVRKILKNSHCTVHPSYYPEGLSNVLLESASSGRPIITTNRSGCREVVEEGINGYIINSKDSKMLINSIEKFIHLTQNEKAQMGLNSRKLVESRFNRRIVVNEYLNNIDKILKYES